MSDTELLVLAAKAAGCPAEVVGDQVWINGDYMAVTPTRPWWPLTDDGDALRLATKLYLSVDLCGDCDEVTVRGSHHSVLAEIVFGKSEDPAPYVRRAIVKAAAEIGRTMP